MYAETCGVPARFLRHLFFNFQFSIFNFQSQIINLENLGMVLLLLYQSSNYQVPGIDITLIQSQVLYNCPL